MRRPLPKPPSPPPPLLLPHSLLLRRNRRPPRKRQSSPRRSRNRNPSCRIENPFAICRRSRPNVVVKISPLENPEQPRLGSNRALWRRRHFRARLRRNEIVEDDALAPQHWRRLNPAAPVASLPRAAPVAGRGTRSAFPARRCFRASQVCAASSVRPAARGACT